MKSIIGLILLLILSGCQKGLEQEAPKRVQSPYDINYHEIIDGDVKQTILINETDQTFSDTTIRRYMYTDSNKNIYSAGMPLVIKYGNRFNLDIINNTAVKTNIHWHGLSLPNDQDGPHLLIDEQGGEYSYSFKPEYSGSYWYHSHNRPVRDQVDFGMHGPLVVLNHSDAQYTLDRIMMLDDWAIESIGGHMQVEGDTDTVNGVSGKEIEPLVINNNDFVKLRLIQASTAKNTELDFPFPVRVTHTDGIALEEPYITESIHLSPGERYDIDFKLDYDQDKNFSITNERNSGMVIPIYYSKEDSTHQFDSLTPTTERIDFLESKLGDQPDITVRMDSQMRPGRGHEWTINGEIFPDAEKFYMKKGQEYLIRFKNDSRMFNHPMHIHGAHFKVISINGVKPDRLMWKDTFNVPAKEYIDVAIVFDNEGEWMLHCHILDHEDGGMMTSIIVE